MDREKSIEEKVNEIWLGILADMPPPQGQKIMMSTQSKTEFEDLLKEPS